jgi:hypothetical protein
MTAPVPGVTYYYDPSQLAFLAPGREPLLIGPAGWTAPDPVKAGSLPVGEAHYGVPDTGQVLFVDPSGSDAAAGTVGAPKKTLAGALSAASTGAVIVLREGSYHESLTVSKAVTIQAYPGEAVWLDGSTQYTSWTGSGPYTATLGPNWSPITTTGFPLTTDPYGNLPEQVWIDGVAQKQIADGATPSAGQFSVNRTAHTVTIGTNPSGKEVRVADLNNAMVISAQVRLYGIGFRRYSPVVQEGLSSLVYFGGSSQGSIVENCVFQDSGHTGLNTARTITLRNITVQDCGAAGIQVTTANGFRMERFVIRRCNRSLWRGQPHTAGIKITRTEGLLVKDGIIQDVPNVIGFWLDVSVTKSVVINLDVDGATVMSAPTMDLGIHSELSDGGLYNGVQHKSWYVNCRVRNTKFSIKFLDAGWTNIANCKFEAYSSVAIYLQQDDRRNPGGRWQGQNYQSGYLGDPYVVPWVGFGTGVLNNEIGQGGLQLIAYHDPPSGTPLMLGWDFIDRIAGNWFRPAPPGSMVQLGIAENGWRTSFNTLPALAASPSTVGVRGNKLGTNHQGNSAPDDSIADELPEEITTLMGVPRGLKRVGPILPAPVATF